MILHLPSLPHTALTDDYSACAFTQKVRRLVTMMEMANVATVTYGRGGDVRTIRRWEQEAYGFMGPKDYMKIVMDTENPMWRDYNARTIEAIEQRIQPGDIVGLIAPAQYPVGEHFRDRHLVCEWGIGYDAMMDGAAHCFESTPWRHYVYGKYCRQAQPDYLADTVIPNCYDPDLFPFVETPENYACFVGRLNARKGLHFAQSVCEAQGLELRVAGQGHLTGYGTHLGMLTQPEVAGLMGHARMTFVPTEYVGPFEGVHVESMLCGTPVITTDHGVFTETVVNRRDGYRCTGEDEMRAALNKIDLLDRAVVRAHAVERFSLRAGAGQYAQWMDRLIRDYAKDLTPVR